MAAPKKRPIVALLERDGEVRATHMNHVTSKNLRDFMVRNADRKSRLHTDESNLYPTLGKEFATHETVNHSMNGICSWRRDYEHGGRLLRRV